MRPFYLIETALESAIFICLSGVCISEVSEVDEGNGGVAKDVPLPPSSRPPATDNSGAFFLNSHV